jgi:hypothetical protein
MISLVSCRGFQLEMMPSPPQLVPNLAISRFHFFDSLTGHPQPRGKPVRTAIQSSSEMIFNIRYGFDGRTA